MSRGDSCGDQSPQGLPIQHLDVFPSQARFQALATVFDAPALAIQSEETCGTRLLGDRPSGKPQPGILIGPQQRHFHQPHLTADLWAGARSPDGGGVRSPDRTGCGFHFDRWLFRTRWVPRLATSVVWTRARGRICPRACSSFPSCCVFSSPLSSQQRRRHSSSGDHSRWASTPSLFSPLNR
jgi:hypothetical protein